MRKNRFTEIKGKKKPAKPGHPGIRNGFTLLEILLAIFIFAIIATTIFGSFASVFSTTDAITENMASYQMAKNCLDRMVLDLRSVCISMPPEYAPPDANDSADPYRVVGDVSSAGSGAFSRLRFASLAHLPMEGSTRDGIAEIVYYVQNTEDDQYVLRRADSLYPYKRFEGKVFEESAGDPILCEGIKSLTFKYYDDEEDETDSWDSESEDSKYSTPRAIRIKLEFGDESSSLFFETMVSLPLYREKKE